MSEEIKKKELTDTIRTCLRSHLKIEASDSYNVLSEDPCISTWAWTAPKFRKTSSLLIILQSLL